MKGLVSFRDGCVSEYGSVLPAVLEECSIAPSMPPACMCRVADPRQFARLRMPWRGTAYRSNRTTCRLDCESRSTSLSATNGFVAVEQATTIFD
jgi:hypothetical protein